MNNNSNLEKYLPAGLITRQDVISGYFYGRIKRPAAKNGCGAVAVYNVMKLLGKEQDFAEVLRELETLRLPWLFGLFGTKPRGLKKYFERHGVPCKITSDCVTFKTELKNCRCAVVCAKNSNRIWGGIHFYTVYPDGKDFKSLNEYYADKPLDYSIEELNPRRFIAGYIFQAS